MPGTITAEIVAPINGNQLLVTPSLFNPNDVTVWKWKQANTAPDEDMISPTAGSAKLEGWLYDRSQLLNAVAAFVGYSYVDYDHPISTNNYPLRRSLPVYHPRWPYMRCTGVTVKGELIDTTTASSANFFGQFDTTVTLPVPNYKQYLFELKFEQPDYNVYPDSVSTTEWDRFVSPARPIDETEMITVDGGLFAYKGITTADSVPVVTNGPGIRLYAQRQGLLIVAHNIAADFLMNQYGIMPKFLAAKGRVNLTSFLGNAAGTMLLKHYDIELATQPVATSVIDALALGMNVKMLFEFTDPDRAVPGETLRGWQLLPPPQSSPSAGWYGVYDKNGKPPYPSYEMNNLLKYWNS